MGLDMYAFSVPAKAVIGDFDFIPDEKQELFYWRKHNALHGWMEDLYRAKGGTEESFNCVPLRLTVENLLELKTCIQNRSLKSRTGFFWGSQRDYDLFDADRDMQFVLAALTAIENGEAVYYDSWW